MAIVNHAKREINAKIVYYGPPGAGKTTTLRYVYDRIKPTLRGEFKALPSSGSSLFFFDFSPFEQPVAGDYRLRLHVYTIQGDVAHAAAWKMTLKGADGLVIVGDGSAGETGELEECVTLLRGFLGCYGIGLDTLPVVLQLNRADLSGPLDPVEIAKRSGIPGDGACQTTAISGEGVLEVLATISRRILERIRERSDLAPESAAGQAEGSSRTVAQALSDEGIPDPAAVEGEPGGAGSSPVRVAVHQDSILSEGGRLRIPLDVDWEGGRRRLVVTVTVEPEESHDH